MPPEHFTIDNFRSVDAIDVYLRAAQGEAEQMATNPDIPGFDEAPLTEAST